RGGEREGREEEELFDDEESYGTENFNEQLKGKDKKWGKMREIRVMKEGNL
ncbi:hypothetical protein U1Q18_043461, partial [Sarracenia purpurea var. burkii]